MRKPYTVESSPEGRSHGHRAFAQEAAPVFYRGRQSWAQKKQQSTAIFWMMLVIYGMTAGWMLLDRVCSTPLDHVHWIRFVCLLSTAVLATGVGGWRSVVSMRRPR